MARFLRLGAICFAAMAFPASAFAGALTLHPSGFGTKSFAAWKAHQGQPDSKGNDAQALYFQKNVPTPVIAAGVAVVRGLEGAPASSLTGLSWEHRTDGHCGAGAPRWDLFLRDAAGMPFTVFLGCAAAAHTPGSAAGWIRDSYSNSAIQAEIAAQTVGGTAPFTIRGLTIVYDEGNDLGFPCPDVGNSCVYLDNIIVNDHCWTGASDNGAGAPTAAECTPASFAGTLPASLTVTTDSGLLTALADMFPTVSPLDWVFYPNVL